MTPKFTLLLLLVLLPGRALFSAEKYPLYVRVYDFTAARDLSSVVYFDLEVVRGKTLLVSPTGSAFYPQFLKSDGAKYFYPVDIQSDTLPLPSNVSSLSSLQRRSLLRMLRDGYITKEMYLSVEEATNVWRPEQIRYAVLWSPVPVEEAKAIFNNEIPWDRVLSGTPGSSARVDKSQVDWEKKDAIWNERLWPKNQPIGITRAGLLTASGQVLDEKTGKVTPLPLSWEKSPLFKDVAPLDRNLFPGAVEVTRLLSESGPEELRGDLRYPLQALIAIHEAEAKYLNIPLDRYATFGWTRDPRRAKFDYRFFGIRPYAKEVAEWFRFNYDDAARNYSRIPLPKDLDHDILLFGLMSDVTERFQTRYISFLENEFVQASGGILNTVGARKLFQKALSDTFRYYQAPPGFDEQTAPVCVTDMSIARTAKLAQYLYDAGITEDAVANRTLRMLETHSSINEPNLFSHRWKEKGYIVPIEEIENQLKGSPFWFIDNIQEEVVRNHPDFLAAMLSSLYHQYTEELWNLPKIASLNLLGGVEQVLGFTGSYRDVMTKYLSLTWFILRTSSRFIAEKAVALGGIERKAVTIDRGEVSLNMNQGHLKMDVDLFGSRNAYAIWFDDRALKKIARSQDFSCAEAVTKALMLQLSPAF